MTSMTDKKTVTDPKLLYARAFDIVWHNANLSVTEKVVLTEVCRYWPRPYSGSNATISFHTGLSIRHIQKVLKALSTGPAKRETRGLSRRRAYIDRGYLHTTHQGKIFTSRVIKPLCLPGPGLPPAQPRPLSPPLP